MPPLARAAALLGVAVTLAVPSAAEAAQTFVVDPAAGGSACSGTTCPTIASALDAAVAGDTVEIREGSYAESVEVTEALTISGAGFGDVKVTGSGAGPVFALQADGVSLSGLTVEAPASGGSAVSAQGSEIVLSDLVASRAGAAGDDPVIDVAGGAALDRAYVTQAGGGDAPAIASTGGGGLQLTDSVALSATGPAILIAESDANRIVRSTVASTAAGAEAVRLEASGSDAAKRLVMDSSYLVAGPGGAALAAVTAGSQAGDVTVVGRHVTARGAKGALLDASGAAGPALPSDPAGNITATFTASIVHGASETRQHVPLTPLTSAPNTVKLSFQRSDAPKATGDGEIAMGGASNTEAASLFAPGSLKLRADAPVIDKGGAPDPDGSARDAEGEARLSGAATDIGADEFHNQAPVARFGITAASVKENRDVGFISGSTDPEQESGGGIAEYRWDFGDGNRTTTGDAAVAHRYSKPGVYRATLQVVDRQGGVSEKTEGQQVIVTDGTAPKLAIAVPGKGQKLKLYRKGRRPLPLTVLGSWSDPSGIESVEVALRLVKRARPAKRRSAAASAEGAARTNCRFYSGRRLVKRQPCDRPLWVKALVRDTGFALQTRKRLRLPRGRYEVRVRGTDRAGNRSSTFRAKDRTRLRFRIR